MTEPTNSLRRRRERLGYTQITFAHAVGVTDRTVRQWESGERVPQRGRHRRIAAALEIDLDEFAVVLAEIQRDHIAFLAGRASPSDDAGGMPPSESGTR